MGLCLLYTTVESVKVRLANKVQFQSNPAELLQGELPDDLLCQLIVDSETAVEQELRGRYMIPFQSKSKGGYDNLPDHTKRAIRMVVDMRSVIMILETDFGRGTHVNGDEYSKRLTKSYDNQILFLLGNDAEGKSRGRGVQTERFRFSPPLDDLLLAFTNREADDGYKGMLINTDANRHSVESYAADQINDPSKAILRRRGSGIL